MLRRDRIRGWRAWTLDGLLLPGANPDLAAHLCEAATGTLLVDLDGNPLTMGRTVRLYQPHQRIAFAVRDGGCVMPGCDQPPEACRAHHILTWARDHGPTNVDTGALLCPRDHGTPHRVGWNMAITADGWTWFTPPTGPSFWGQRHGIQHPGPTPDHPDYTGPPSIARHPRARHLEPPPAQGDAPPTTSPSPTPIAHPATANPDLPSHRFQTPPTPTPTSPTPALPTPALPTPAVPEPVLPAVPDPAVPDPAVPDPAVPDPAVPDLVLPAVASSTVAAPDHHHDHGEPGPRPHTATSNERRPRHHDPTNDEHRSRRHDPTHTAIAARERTLTAIRRRLHDEVLTDCETPLIDR